MKKLALLYLIVVSLNVYAAVPTVNATDYTWKIKYTGQAMSYLTWLANAANTAQQTAGLQGLQQFEKGGKSLCELCSPQDMQDLQITLGGINGGLCQSFSQIMSKLTGVQQQYQSLNQIQSALQSNPAEATLALQQASLQSQLDTQQTLQQMQAMQAQEMQKKLVEDKIQSQARNSMWTGIKGGSQ